MFTFPLLVATALAGQLPLDALSWPELPIVRAVGTEPNELIAPVAYDWPGGEPLLRTKAGGPTPTSPLDPSSRPFASPPLLFEDLERLPITAEEMPWLAEPVERLTVWQQIGADYTNFYSTSRLPQQLVAFGAAASLAFSNGDSWLGREYQEDVRSPFTDRWFNQFRWIGEWKILGPVAFGAWGLAELLPAPDQEGLWREWSRRTARSYLVGTPAMLTMQWVTGGSRPGEAEHGSAWRPFTDANGVSGHAFTGAVPFMAAAQMTEDWRLKSLLYITSTFTGLSRFNDDKHYASQVLLGLWMAHVATQSVSETQVGHYRVLVAPTLVGDGYGLSLLGSW